MGRLAFPPAWMARLGAPWSIGQIVGGPLWRFRFGRWRGRRISAKRETVRSLGVCSKRKRKQERPGISHWNGGLFWRNSCLRTPVCRTILVCSTRKSKNEQFRCVTVRLQKVPKFWTVSGWISPSTDLTPTLLSNCPYLLVVLEDGQLGLVSQEQVARDGSVVSSGQLGWILLALESRVVSVELRLSSNDELRLDGLGWLVSESVVNGGFDGAVRLGWLGFGQTGFEESGVVFFSFAWNRGDLLSCVHT
jgi:hypothetical protein